MAAGKGLPQQHADRPHVGRGSRRLPTEPFRRDVRERAGNVAGGRQRLRLWESREPEVEQPHRHAIAVCEQDVRRLHVAVNDPARMRVRKPFEHLNGGFDRRRVVELARAQSLAKRAPRRVLVRDVDVLRVAAEPVGALAARMPETGGRLCLPLRARARLALPRDDLQGDVEPVLLVPSKPHGSRPTRPERPEGAVPAEDQIGLKSGCSGVLHGFWMGWPDGGQVLFRPDYGIE